MAPEHWLSDAVMPPGQPEELVQIQIPGLTCRESYSAHPDSRLFHMHVGDMRQVVCEQLPGLVRGPT